MKAFSKLKIENKALIISVFLSIIFGLLLPFTWTDLQGFQLWNEIDIIITESYPYLTLFKLIHHISGILLFAFGSYNCIIVIKINRDAHSVRNSPDYLLTDGYYEKTRNPMYTYFLFIFSALSFVLCSSLALAIAGFVVIVLYVLIFIEEKYMLIPKFNNEYLEYKKKVPRRLLRNWHLLLFFSLLSFNIIGIFF